MISGVRKIPILRYFLIILLFGVLIIGILFLFFHYKKAQKLQYSIENLISARENSALIDSCIINLYGADNNSRLYTITGDKKYLHKFSKDLNNISEIIDKIKFDKKYKTTTPPTAFKELMRQKTEKTDNYIKLRLLTDSLIRYSIRINNSLKHINQQLAKPVVKVVHTVTIDTIKDKSKPKKKLIGRIFAAFSAKKQNADSTPVVVKKDTLTTSVLMAKGIGDGSKRSFKNYYKTLNSVNNKLRVNEQQILLINNNLIEEIIASLKLYKSIEQLYINNSKNELKGTMYGVFFEFRQISAVGMFFLSVLIIIVLYNIWKIFRNEQDIIEYSDKTEQYALSKSRFLAGMSHEIRTPLNSVIGFSEQLQQENLPAAQREQVEAIRTSSEMLLELVNEILDFSKYETGKMNFESAPFMLGQTINEIYGTMHIHALKKRILLENQIDIDDAICCEGDKMRLKQVIMNLLGNAIKFTVKGKVTLKAFIEEKTDGDLLLCVTVSDTGLGIDKNDLPFIFDEFSQVATAQKMTRHKGTGLGLAICKKIIELQDGSIGVDSKLGQGSVFSFELPLKQCQADEIPSAQFLSDELMAELVKDKKVLFAEDNQLNVLLGTTILKKWKIKYDVAYNGLDALELFKKNDYDVVLTDIQMPEMNGLELTEQIRKGIDLNKAATTIMALTANVMKEDRDIYLKAGINDVVLKPFLEKNLIEKIAMAIQNSINVDRLMS